MNLLSFAAGFACGTAASCEQKNDEQHNFLPESPISSLKQPNPQKIKLPVDVLKRELDAALSEEAI